MKKLLLLLYTVLSAMALYAQEHRMKLWEGNPPNYKQTSQTKEWSGTDLLTVRNINHPEIDVYLPEGRSANGQAVIICPGGGYYTLAYHWEGTYIAKWLNSKGIAGIVLKYRLPRDEGNIVPHKSPLLDAQRAIRLTRAHAAEWNIHENQVGIMGFSAGGHLAATAATHFDSSNANNADSVDRLSSRPDFAILVYPVITFQGDQKHSGSMKSLLGNEPDPQLVEYYSNELQVTEHTPPTFLVHAQDDAGVPVANSLLFYSALVRNNVPAEMHLYPEGGHGFSLAVNKGHEASWTDACIRWMHWLYEKKKP
jgi:acetyl esterase/lipase